ncbi:RING finger protein vilya-like [Episyrphus balteatus]|uniref:RING finger protein vilya-like n=1 Tax=Episyrphus balteatus TaxID=286459 RepID=UPI002485D95B|nr:RING finger protein vilya-like [Episyrphus balteatus]
MTSAQRKCTSKWIHCNRCMENYMKKERKLYILSCYDVVCETCLMAGNKEKMCPVCKNIVRGFVICNNLPPKLKEMFHPRPWSLKFNRTSTVYKFQKKQRNSFLTGCKKLREFLKYLEKNRNTMKEDCKNMYLNHKQLKKDHSKLKGSVKRFKEMRAAKQRAQHGLYANRSHGFDMFEAQTKINRSISRSREISSTCHMMQTSRNENVFEISSDEDSSPSRSFYL